LLHLSVPIVGRNGTKLYQKLGVTVSDVSRNGTNC